MMVTVLRGSRNRGGLLDDIPNLAAYMKRGEARPAFQQALADQLAAFREHEPRRRSSMSYVDGFILPLPKGKEDEYRKLAETFARKAAKQGAIGSRRVLGDGLEHGHTTDFFRAVQAEDGENVVFSFVLWPSKDVRDTAWEKIMADPEMQPGAQPMPFDGKRMFWGGFKPIVEHAGEGLRLTATISLRKVKP